MLPDEGEAGPLPARVELQPVPFFPSDDDQCGPAALATVLNHQGVRVDPARLRPQVYLPGRKGSLQAEVLALPARYGLLAVRLPASPAGLLRELAAGHPVLVLQNLGLDSLPQWHYAVLVGYDLDRREVYLRSGDRRRRVRGWDLFLASWMRAGRWAVVVLQPGELPATATPAAVVKAASALERDGHLAAARKAYVAATRRWPRSQLAWAGLGNAAYSADDFETAASAYRRALELRPGDPRLMNNLALALAQRGCRDQALAWIACALRQRPDDAGLLATRAEIRGLEASEVSCAAAACGPPP